MAITWAGNVAVVAPELANAPPALQNLLLAIAARQVDPDTWGDMADDGQTYLAAHLGSMSFPGGAGAIGGAVTGETLGQMSRSYGIPPGVSGELAATRYGQTFMQLRRIAVGPGAMIAP